MYYQHEKYSQKTSSSILILVLKYHVSMCTEILLKYCNYLSKYVIFSFSKTYQLLDFENSANYKNIQAEKILDRFFG